MTIRDIAKSAGVSVATVSRILNHKDKSISEETRQRVLQIVAENDYVPYAKLRDKLLSETHTLGLIVPTLQSAFYAEFTSVIQRVAKEQGYSLLLAISEGLDANVLTSLQNFHDSKADGILLFPADKKGIQLLESFSDSEMSAVILDYNGQNAHFPSVYRNFSACARTCTEELLRSHHHRIAVLTRAECGSLVRESTIEGYSEALLAHGIPLDSTLIFEATADNVSDYFDQLMLMSVDSILCQDEVLAGAVYACAAQRYLTIPDDFSVITTEGAASSKSIALPLSGGSTDVESMAQLALLALLQQIQNQTSPFTVRVMETTFSQNKSVNIRPRHTKKLVVVGSMNMDIMLYVPHLPHHSETLMATDLSKHPGGKGANQAYGICRFGATAQMLGCLGNDHYGKQIYAQLSRAGVLMDAVSFVPDLPTGTAYCNICPDGKNSIVVCSGANSALNTDYVEQHDLIFRDAAYCLVQLEIPVPAVTAILECCQKNQVPVILKPSPAKQLSDSFLEKTFLLVPNEEEALTLCPGIVDPVLQAKNLLARGAQHVIITLAEKGCIYVTHGVEQRYPAKQYTCIDSTGASDVFVSCLAVMLAEGKRMDEAITGASWAASYSVAFEGVQQSIPERKLLDDLMQGRITIPPAQ